MKTYGLPEFARRFHRALTQEGIQVVWFLGAGCSISSGIPGAGALVAQWMETIEEFKGEQFRSWADATCQGWEQDPASVYGLVIEERFDGAKARQDEIARLVDGKEPGFGYACLAQLMSHDVVGRRNNVALTTNFDDLIADALYLYTHQKPLVVAHESLSRFMRSSDGVPLVVKVHGDAQLAPRNTAAETKELHHDLVHGLRGVLHDAVFVFIGYAGGDASISSFVSECAPQQIAGAYWVGDQLPTDPDLSAWLDRHPGGVHVTHRDFDALMAELRSLFGLGRPAFDRFDRLRESYISTARELRADGDSGASDRGVASADRAIDELEGWRLDAQGIRLGHTDLEHRLDLHRRAADAAPGNADIAGNHAMALALLHRWDEAEATYLAALELDDQHQNNLAAYAELLVSMGRRAEAADVLRRAEAVPGRFAHSCGSIALVHVLLGNPSEAESWFREALDLDPRHPNNLANFANFLFLVGRRDEAREVLKRALERLDASDLEPVGVEVLFYAAADRTPGVEPLGQLKSYLRKGVRSLGWDLSPVIEAMTGDGEDTGLLEALAKVVSGEAPIEMLDAFPEWRDA